mmetsp:Transcript_68796/g.164136  ORF Transcript_68796/g.164136 Transcript_68796/m.164136 type:complete len:235 (+) Transcript_68796:139-843(+)
MRWSALRRSSSAVAGLSSNSTSFIHASACSPSGSLGRSKSVAPPRSISPAPFFLPFLSSSLASSSSRNSREFFSNSSSSSTTGLAGVSFFSALLSEAISELSEGIPSRNSCLKFSMRFTSASNDSSPSASSPLLFLIITADIPPNEATATTADAPMRAKSGPLFCTVGSINVVPSDDIIGKLSPAAFAVRGATTPNMSASPITRPLDLRARPLRRPSSFMFSEFNASGARVEQA